MKLRDLAATLVPRLMHYAETGHLRVPPETDDAVDLPEEYAVYFDAEDFPGEIDVEALQMLTEYLSKQWMPPDVKQAYDQVVKGLHYDS